MTASATVTFPTVLVVRDDRSTNQLENVQMTCTVTNGHKEYCLEVSELTEFLMPKVLVLTTSANVQEFFERMGLETNQDGELLHAVYYRQDCNGTAHFLKLFND